MTDAVVPATVPAAEGGAQQQAQKNEEEKPSGVQLLMKVIESLT